MRPIEQKIRKQLGVPENVSSVLFLGMDAHMDWDWLETFPTLLVDPSGQAKQFPVVQIMAQAWQLMLANSGQSGNPYMYSVCEMGFLRAALAQNPQLLQQFQSGDLSKQLAIQGGGITSPDNLLPHGEAFIRNYLVGGAWQRATLGLSTNFAYLPDDFGHDAQLPVMIEAMGFAAVCFSRLPGSSFSSVMAPLDGSPSLYCQLIGQGGTNPNCQAAGQGCDLYWQASDGSSVFAHVEQDTYAQGNGIEGNDDLMSYLSKNQPSSLSPYIYVPCGNDFAAPIQSLLQIAADWNANPLAPDTYVAVGTLDQYIQLVMSWSKANPGRLVTRPMDPTPYWTGFYASRPANKILHHAAVRALLGAEVFGVIADLLQPGSAAAARQAALAQGWENLLPSTHHDYITGTALDSVYIGEQWPLLTTAHNGARSARTTAMETIAALIDATPKPNETPVAVFNQLGFETTGLVEMPALPGLAIQGVRPESGVPSAVQTTTSGTLLFMASAPSLGYATCYLSAQASEQPPFDGGVSVTVTQNGDVTLQNGQLALVVSAAAQWGITSLRPIVGGVLQPDLLAPGQIANALTFYQDLGNIYDFGNEFDPSGLTIADGELTPIRPALIIEDGPLRARVAAQVAFSDGNAQATYTLEYTLIAGEPFVRMAVTGSVPLSGGVGTSSAVMVKFPFSAPTKGVIRGTPYHWHDQLPVPYWNPPTFQATHHFVVPTSAGVPQGALYHSDLPAWAIDDTGAMIGCILRNAPGSGFPGRGADGTDPGVYTRRYALRIPQGVELPAPALSLFQESWNFANPLQSALITTPAGSAGAPADFSLASVTTGNAVITAAKWEEPVGTQPGPSSMILRLYQPSNSPQSVSFSLDGYLQLFEGPQPPQVIQVTALEQPLPDAQPLPVNGGQVALTMSRALATLSVSPAGSDSAAKTAEAK